MREAFECDYYRDDEDGIYCVFKADRCRFVHRHKCKDFETIIGAQKKADLKQGTNFTEILYGDRK